MYMKMFQTNFQLFVSHAPAMVILTTTFNTTKKIYEFHLVQVNHMLILLTKIVIILIHSQRLKECLHVLNKQSENLNKLTILHLKVINGDNTPIFLQNKHILRMKIQQSAFLITKQLNKNKKQFLAWQEKQKKNMLFIYVSNRKQLSNWLRLETYQSQILFKLINLFKHKLRLTIRFSLTTFCLKKLKRCQKLIPKVFSKKKKIPP